MSLNFILAGLASMFALQAQSVMSGSRHSTSLL
jgi:hypothetical protein